MALPWLLRMRWIDLLFAHWPIDPDVLAARLPAGLVLDSYQEQAWLGIVPFTMADVAPRGVPAVPRFSTFPEINVRTYVLHDGRPGIYFLSLDAMSRPTVEGARRVFHLPYFRAAMSSRIVDGWVEYRSRRVDGRGPDARFEATYRATGPPAPAQPGSLEAWLTDRTTLFALDGRGHVRPTRIAHAPWPLQPAEASITAATMASAHGLDLPGTAPHLLYAARLDVHAWLPDRA